MPIFSNYLRNIRHQKGLTQRDAIDLLVAYDETFNKLDLTTFSRWEKQKTSPSLARKILLLRGLGGSTMEILEPLLQSQEPSVNNNINSILSAQVLDPYSLDKEKFQFKTFRSLITEPALEERIHIFHHNFIKMPLKLGDYFATEKVRLNALMDDKDRLLGHMLFGFSPIGNSLSNLDVKVLDELLHRDESKLITQNSIINVLSVYGTTPYSRLLNVVNILKLIRDYPRVKAILVTFHFQDAFDYFQNISSGEILETGEPSDAFGIKTSGKTYRYARVLLRSEDILSSADLLDHIVNCERYLNNLMIESQ